MKKILFGITGLTLGGAERVLVDIANKLCEKYEITIFTIYAKGELEKQLDKRIKLKSLYNVKYIELSKLKRKIIAPLKVLMLKRYIYNKYVKEDYDVEIAFLEGPITRILACKNMKTKKVAWIHNDISQVFGNNKKATLKKWIDEKIYSKYQELIFVSRDNLNKFNKVYNTSKINKIPKKVIYNYINTDLVQKKAKAKKEITFNKEQLNFLTIGRLVEQKAFDRLIKIHSKLTKDGFIHNVYVIGEGPKRQELEELIKKHKVEKTFQLLGKLENPYPYIKDANYFCLLSYFEGYGMVLEEAKILNKPIIITDTAAREATIDYKNSIILENSEKAIYEGLKKIIKNHDNKQKENVENKIYDNSKRLKEIMEVIGE